MMRRRQRVRDGMPQKIRSGEYENDRYATFLYGARKT